MIHLEVTYRNGQKGRLLYKKRVNTPYCVLSVRLDGTLMHNTAEGYARFDQEENPWDIIQGLQEPAYIVAYATHDDPESQFEVFHTGDAAALASARFDQLKAGEQMRSIMLAQVIKEELSHE